MGDYLRNSNAPAFHTAIYIRLSREDGDKEESDSVGNQRKLLTDYVASKEDFALHEVYVDDGYTGTNFRRPAFQRMIADIEAGMVNCVVVKDLSRFGRDYIDTGRYLERIFPEFGVRFISVADQIDSIKKAYDMLLPIKNIFNEQYARDISDKIHATVKAKQRAGEFIGAFTSYGYRKSSVDKNKLVTDEYAAEIVRRIFAMFTAGCGKQQIAKRLNEEGVLSPAEYKKVNGENYKNCNCRENAAYWSYSTINSILHKEIYVGNMVQGTKEQHMRSRRKNVAKEDWIVVRNTHEPIIDRDTWEKAQSLLKKRIREPVCECSENIFSGFLKCGDCGRAMVKNYRKKADGSRVYYFYCGTYKRNGKNFCAPHTLALGTLEEIVLEDLQRAVKSVGDLRRFVQSAAEREESGCVREVGEEENTHWRDTKWRSEGQIQRYRTQEADRARIELERVQRLKKGIYEDYKGEIITREEYFSYRQEYRKKEELCKARLQVLEKVQNGQKEKDISEIPWVGRLLEKGCIEELDREIVAEMISGITVYAGRRIKITYHFS